MERSERHFTPVAALVKILCMARWKGPPVQLPVMATCWLVEEVLILVESGGQEQVFFGFERTDVAQAIEKASLLPPLDSSCPEYKEAVCDHGVAEVPSPV